MSECPVFVELACRCGSFFVESVGKCHVRVTVNVWPMSRTCAFNLHRFKPCHTRCTSRVTTRWERALAAKQAAFPSVRLQIPKQILAEGEARPARAAGQEGEAAKAAQSKTDFVSHRRHDVLFLLESIQPRPALSLPREISRECAAVAMASSGLWGLQRHEVLEQLQEDVELLELEDEQHVSSETILPEEVGKCKQGSPLPCWLESFSPWPSAARTRDDKDAQEQDGPNASPASPTDLTPSPKRRPRQSPSPDTLQSPQSPRLRYHRATAASASPPSRREAPKRQQSSAAWEALSAQVRSLEAELSASEFQEQRSSAEHAAAKAEWSGCVANASSQEAREERRLQSLRSERAELSAEGEREDAFFRQERDRLRQRLRTLKMQARQANQKAAEAPLDHLQCLDEASPARIQPSQRSLPLGSPAARESKGPCNLGASNCRGGTHPEETRPALREIQDVSAGRLERLRSQRDGLQKRAEELRHSCLLSDRELAHAETLELLRSQEAEASKALAEQQRALRKVELEADAAHRHAAETRKAQRQVATELCAAEELLQLQSQRQEVQGLPEILRSRQKAIAAWVEADVGMRQVTLVKRRLQQMVEDYGYRAKVLEDAIAEIHVDLDLRAGSILELQGQQGQQGQQPLKGSLEAEALEAELSQEQELFDLRHRQVQGLEERLQDLLAEEGPRMEVLGAWVAVHEPLLTKELEKAEQTEHTAEAEVRSEEAKQELCADMAKQRRSEFDFLTEASAAAVEEADKAAREAAVLYRQRGILLRDVDGLAREERAAALRADSASERLRRDRRRAVAATTKQLWEPGRASLLRGTCPKEARKRAAAQAEEMVEASRGRQLQELQLFNEEISVVSAEMVELRKDLAKAEDAGAERQWKQSEEAQRQSKVAATPKEVTARSLSGTRKGSVGKKASQGRLEMVATTLRELEQQEQAQRTARECRAAELTASLEAAEASLQRCRADHRAASAGALRRLRRSARETEEAERRCCELAVAKDRVCLALRDVAFAVPAGDEASQQAVEQPAPGPNLATEERRPGAGEEPINPELLAFYRQVLPLLRGSTVGALRPPRKALEERQLVLSSDLQRLELWMPTDSPARLDRAETVEHPVARKRVADAFLRLDMLTRVHLPKATLLAMQRKEGAETRSKPRFWLRFELVVLGSDTWHLATSDVQTLQAITSAVTALLTARKKLGALALSARQQLDAFCL
ncbi:unnamed protein product [Symbiodinium sp. CCMP2592]|nr:unnamed protein product [Symbiodinium sp. CCMP2592]